VKTLFFAHKTPLSFTLAEERLKKHYCLQHTANGLKKRCRTNDQKALIKRVTRPARTFAHCKGLITGATIVLDKKLLVLSGENISICLSVL
jgi:hypothetical protein